MTKPQAMVRVLAGGYLIYLVYEMITDKALESNTGWKLVLMAAAMVAFVVFGALFAWQGIRAIKNNDFYVPPDSKDAEADGAEDEEESGDSVESEESEESEEAVAEDGEGTGLPH